MKKALSNVLPAALTALLLGGPAAAAPPSPAATKGPAPAEPEAAPRSADPRAEALHAWIQGYFPWGEGEITSKDVSELKVPGYRILLVSKKFKADARANDQTYAVLDDSGKTALLGDVFVDEVRLKAPKPIRADADLEALRQQLQKFFRGRFRVVFEPSLDRRGWKGLKITPDSGYGSFEISGFVSAESGAVLMVGRFWERGRSIAEQRKAMIQLAGTPATGPPDATVTVVEYSDMQCPFCKKRAADWEALVDKLGPVLKIRRYLKSFPLTNEHPWAFRAASAGRCFFERDPTLYLRWKAQVLSRQELLSVPDLDTFAMDFALANDFGEEPFRKCYLQGSSVSHTLGELSEGFAVRVRATPTYFIDGVAVSWFADNLMEEYLRKTYLKGAGLPLPVAAQPKEAAKK